MILSGPVGLIIIYMYFFFRQSLLRMFSKDLFILCLLMFCLHVCMCTVWVPGARGGQKATDPLELELWVIVSRYVGSGNQTQVLCGRNKT